MGGALAVFTATLPGCSKSSASSGTVPATSAQAPSSSARAAPGGVTETEIVIGEPAAFTGASAGLGIEFWRGATAAFSVANDAGGIAGRKVRLVVADDAYDPEKAAPAVVQLVEQSGVLLVFGGVGTPTIVRALPVVKSYWEESGLFYFANFTGAQPQRRPPNVDFVFNVRASYAEETKAIVDTYAAMGKKRVGVYLQDDAYGVDGREGVLRALKDHGLALASEARYPRGQTFATSTAPQLDVLRKDSVDAVVMVGAYQACAAFVRDARRAGWDAPIAAVSFVGADQMLSLLRSDQKPGETLSQRLVITQVVPYYEDTTIAVVRDYRAAIDRYRPTAPPSASDAYHPASPYTFGSLEGFVSARALVLVLQKAGHDLTRQSAYAAAEAMGTFDLGLGAPAELSHTRHQVLDKVWFTAATPAGWKPTDDPASALR